MNENTIKKYTTQYQYDWPPNTRIYFFVQDYAENHYKNILKMNTSPVTKLKFDLVHSIEAYNGTINIENVPLGGDIVFDDDNGYADDYHYDTADFSGVKGAIRNIFL